MKVRKALEPRWVPVGEGAIATEEKNGRPTAVRGVILYKMFWVWCGVIWIEHRTWDPEKLNKRPAVPPSRGH